MDINGDLAPISKSPLIPKYPLIPHLLIYLDKECFPLAPVPHLSAPQPSGHTCGTVLFFKCDPGEYLLGQWLIVL